MLKEIWEGRKDSFTFIYDHFISKLIKPIHITLTIFCLYCFLNSLMHGRILLAFANLFATITFFTMWEDK